MFQNAVLVQYFLKLKPELNLVLDKESKSPLVYALYPQITSSSLIIATYLFGAPQLPDPNILYAPPTDENANDKKGKEKLPRPQQSAEKTCLLIHAVLQSPNCYELAEKVVKLFIKNKVNINVQDSTGKTAIMYAVCDNNEKMVKLLLANKEAATEPAANQKERMEKIANINNVDLNLQDSNGKTVLHLVVNPLPFGSYENTHLLEILVNAGAKLAIKDKQGEISSLSPPIVL